MTILICQRFKFEIRINCQIKQFDFDFLITQNIKEGYLKEKIYCLIDKEDNFDFFIFIGISENRLCELNFEKEYDENLVNLSEIKEKNDFIKFCQIKINIKLLKKEETNVKLRAVINGLMKELNIIFTFNNNFRNSGYKFIGNELKNIDNNSFFCFNFNELNAHGIKRKSLILKDNNPMKNPGFIGLKHFNYSINNKLEEININLKDININSLTDFYNRITEEARLLPIYFLNSKDEGTKKSIKKNYHILETIYDSLTMNEKQNIIYNNDNFFYKEIRDFVEAFNYMNFIIEMKDDHMENLINDIKDYIKNNRKIENRFFKWLYEKFFDKETEKKLRDYIRKHKINLDDFSPDDLNKIQNFKTKDKINETKTIKGPQKENNDTNEKNEKNSQTQLSKEEIEINSSKNKLVLHKIKNETKNEKELINNIEHDNNNNKDIKKISEILDSIIGQQNKKKDREEQQINEIKEEIKKKSSAYLKQDIWKQNDKSKVFSKRKENPEDNINDYLNNQLHSNVKLIQNQKKVNSLEDIKRDIRMREEMLKARNNELVNENEIRNSEPIVPGTNFNKKLYFPKKIHCIIKHMILRK